MSSEDPLHIVLTTTWAPYGELPRLQRLADDLLALFERIIVVMPPDVDPDNLWAVQAIQGFTALADPYWQIGRQTALLLAARTDADHILYCDMDRLLHWAEAHPQELAQTLPRIAETDCLVIGRTEAAWETHPRCMVETEALFNRAFSHLVGSQMDFGASARGLSRAGAQAIIEAYNPQTYFVDVAWPLLLHREGYHVDYVAVEGMAWETPDRHHETIADEKTRKRAAAAADADPAEWQRRVGVAASILNEGLAVWEAHYDNHSD